MQDLAGLDDVAFRRRFAGSAVKRLGRDRFIRNVAIALGNAGEREAIAVLERLLDDPSALVRGAAVWAIGALDPDRLAKLKSLREKDEPDSIVRAEWAGEDSDPGLYVAVQKDALPASPPGD